MQLKSLSIELVEWGADKGQFRGTARFVNEGGAFDVRLSDELSRGCLKLCAEARVSQANKLAMLLTQQVIEGVSQPQLPAE